MLDARWQTTEGGTWSYLQPLGLAQGARTKAALGLGEGAKPNPSQHERVLSLQSVVRSVDHAYQILCRNSFVSLIMGLSRTWWSVSGKLKPQLSIQEGYLKHPCTAEGPVIYIWGWFDIWHSFFGHEGLSCQFCCRNNVRCAVIAIRPGLEIWVKDIPAVQNIPETPLWVIGKFDNRL